MDRCGSCKFWGRLPRKNGEVEVQDGEWRQCGRVLHDEDSVCQPDKELVGLYGQWDPKTDMMVHDEFSLKKLNDPIRRELAVVQDGSGYHAALKSRADFGCVLFAPLEDA